MKKKVSIIVFLSLIFCQLMPLPVSAKIPPVMDSLKSYIQVYGALKSKSSDGVNRYSSAISYQKKKKWFVFQCAYTNGNSKSSVKMYMPVSKKQAKYTVTFNETIRASGLTARISGKAKIRRKTYNDWTTVVRFSRKNKTAVSRRITNPVYQSAANSLLRIAFKMWENE